MHHKDTTIDAVFAREYPELFSYLSRYITYRIPNKESAEDVISETFLYGYAHRRSFDPTRGNLRQWLTGIAKHKIADHWKTIQPTAALEEAEKLCNETDRLSLDNALDAQARVHTILSQLTEEARALLTLRHIDGMTHDEIAALIHKKPSTVRTFISRLHSRIRHATPL